MPKTAVICLLCLSVLAFDSPAHTETVNVGGYHFPPFVELTGDKFTGLTLDLIAAINSFQDLHRFVFIPTSSKRRYRDFNDREFDMLFFEDLRWGWEDKKMQASRVFLQGGEVYIAKAAPSRDQNFFQNFKGKTMAGYLGYHYGFANFNADDQYLHDIFNMELSTTHEGNIKKVLRGLVDIAVITKSYLDRYLKQHPGIKDQLLISVKSDQIYRHTILVRKGARPSAAEINTLLDQMEQAGVLSRLWQKYGIK